MSERKIQLLRAPSGREAGGADGVAPRSGGGDAAPVTDAREVLSRAPSSPVASTRPGSLPPTASTRPSSLPPTASTLPGSLPPSASTRSGSLPPTASTRSGSLPPRATSGAPLPEGGAAGLWREVLLRLEDEALHQSFLSACLAEGRMTFALECYRTLERLRPGDPIAARYLGQVAKALELGALGAHRAGEDAPHARPLRRALQVLMALVIGILGMLALYGLIRFAEVALAP